MGAWYCVVCTDTGQGERFDLDARKHEAATGHGTVTSTADGPLARSRQEPQP
jgi:hypothetical protein